MADDRTEPFADVLRRARQAAQLTQTELAERANLSVRGLSDLERGVNRRPRRETIQTLVDALQLSSTQEAEFRAAARPLLASAPGELHDSGHPPADSPPVQTFLIADIRGYTHFLVEHGNDAGAALAMRFANVAGATIEAHHGQVVELRGDEVLAVFSSASQALYAAVELQQRCRQADEAPLPVGVGLDAGETIAVEGHRHCPTQRDVVPLFSARVPGAGCVCNFGVVVSASRTGRKSNSAVFGPGLRSPMTLDKWTTYGEPVFAFSTCS